jgi:hypothetical protein
MDSAHQFAQRNRKWKLWDHVFGPEEPPERQAAVPTTGGTTDHVLGYRLFADGVTRSVYLDAAGKQDVVGTDGEPVPGVWVLPPEVPSDPRPQSETAP